MWKKLTVVTSMFLFAWAAWQSLNAPGSAAQKAGEVAAQTSSPAWLDSEPLITVGNWDSMPIFRRRVGGGTTWQEDDYRKERRHDLAGG